MNVKETKFTLKNMTPRESVLIEGDHGLGKSEVIAQVVAELSKELGKPFQLIDFRLAQCEVGDLIGMMRHVDTFQAVRCLYVDGKKVESSVEIKNCTVHDIADWFPTDPDSYGYLFLDELWRASRDLQNAVMELALDYRYHFRELPQNWRVVAASNNNMQRYKGTVPEPALYSRFLKIQFGPTTEEWLDHASDKGIHIAVIKYISKIPGDLEIPETYEPGTIVPDRRSWFKLGKDMNHFAEIGHDMLNDLGYLTQFAIGRLGSSVAVNFVEYIRKSYKIYSPEDILDKITNVMEQEFQNSEPAEIGYYNRILVKYMKKSEIELTKKQSDNLARYVKAIPRETASGFWEDFLTQCPTVAQKWYKEIPGMPEYIWSLLNKDQALAEAKPVKTKKK